MNSLQTQNRVPQTLRQQLSGDYFKQQVALALPKHMTPERFVRVALTALLKTPKLADCTPESVVQCMLNCSALGLEPDGRRVHLIPYGNVCTMIVDYKGIVELAKRSGDVANVFAQVVCENDSFVWENGEVKHQIDFKRDRGPMYAAYAVITFKDGTKQTDVMTKGEIDAIRKRSRAGNSGPWVTDYNEMSKKTVFRRASKWIVLSPEIAEALEKEDAPFTAPQSLVTEFQPPIEIKTVSQAEQEQSCPPVDEQVAGEGVPSNPKEDTLQQQQTIQQQLERVVTEKGFSYDDFANWAEGSGNMPDAKSFSSFSEVNTAIAKRLMRSTAGMLKGIAQSKGIEA